MKAVFCTQILFGTIGIDDGRSIWDTESFMDLIPTSILCFVFVFNLCCAVPLLSGSSSSLIILVEDDARNVLDSIRNFIVYDDEKNMSGIVSNLNTFWNSVRDDFQRMQEQIESLSSKLFESSSLPAEPFLTLSNDEGFDIRQHQLVSVENVNASCVMMKLDLPREFTFVEDGIHSGRSSIKGNRLEVSVESKSSSEFRTFSVSESINFENQVRTSEDELQTWIDADTRSVHILVPLLSPIFSPQIAGVASKETLKPTSKKWVLAVMGVSGLLLVLTVFMVSSLQKLNRVPARGADQMKMKRSEKLL